MAAPLTYHTLTTQFTTHILTHIRATYLSCTHHLPLTHTHTHPWPPYLPLTYSLLTTHTLTYASPTYHSHNYPCRPHLSLRHSSVEYDVLRFVKYVLVFRRNLVPLLQWNSRAEGTGSFLFHISVYRERTAVTGKNIHSRISLFQHLKSIPPCFVSSCYWQASHCTKMGWIPGHYAMWGQSGTGTGFSPSTSTPFSQHPSAITPYSDIFHLITKPSLNRIFICFL